MKCSRRTQVVCWITAFAIMGMVAFAIVYVRIDQWAGTRVAETHARAEEIIGALEAFRQAKGQYPHGLQELLPEFITQLKPPTAGNRKWQYGVNEAGTVFDLKFEGDTPAEPTHIYSSDERAWWVDTK